MSFTLIRCKDAWSSNYRYIESDIAPLEQIPTPKHYDASSGFFYPAGDYYRSAGRGEGDFIYFNLYFAEEPTITQYTMGHNMSGAPSYDSNLGLWVWRQNTSFGLGSNWTDQSAPITSDFGEHFYSYLQSGVTRQMYIDYIMLPYTPTYNWQSVPSIIGKNGILSLSTINDSAINNGNPVTGATSDTFYSTEDSKVEELVTYATPIDSSKLESFTCIYQATLPFTALKLLVKKNSAPQDEEDADLVINLPNPTLSTGIDEYTATNLDPLTNYFCVVQVSDSGGHYKYSDPAEVRTGFMDRNFDYTGAIQTFTAPKTGIYQLETWGAQGGDATDGTNTARGGYGAYAYGEMLLQQGETIYINVGGQNGYGGGGVMPYINPDYILESANSQIAEVVFEGYNIHRVFYKTNSGFSCALMLYIDNYVGCVLLSNESASSVYYKAIDDGSVEYTNNAYFTINYRGQVWYMSKTGLFAVNAYGTWDYPVLHISAVDYPSMTSGVYDEAEITQFLDLAFEVLGQ